MELEGSNEDGRVRCWLSGNQQPLRINIESSLLEEENSKLKPLRVKNIEIL